MKVYSHGGHHSIAPRAVRLIDEIITHPDRNVRLLQNPACSSVSGRYVNDTGCEQDGPNRPPVRRIV